MWIKILEFALSAGSYLYNYWQKVHQKQQITAEIKASEVKANEEAIKSANDIRATNLPDSLLLPPEQRNSK